MASLIGIPPQRFWPQGMTTDFVSVFPDAPVLWAPGPWPHQWLRRQRVDLRVPAWWHDARYYLGRFIPRTIPWEDLAEQVPLQNHDRSEVQRRVIDEHLRVDFLTEGLTPWTAARAAGIVRRFGASHFYWLTPARWDRMARPWERIA